MYQLKARSRIKVRLRQWFHSFGFCSLLITVEVCACERLLCSTRYLSRWNKVIIIEQWKAY